jgi:hypothetical protein
MDADAKNFCSIQIFVQFKFSFNSNFRSIQIFTYSIQIWIEQKIEQKLKLKIERKLKLKIERKLKLKIELKEIGIIYWQ